MEWLNLHSSVLDSPEVIGEDPVNRATWLFLLRYCIGQENGGRIEGARSWGDRKWQQLIRVTKREVLRDASLWKWEGDALIVFAYPCDRERLVKSKREVARENGLRGGRPKHNPAQTKAKPTSEPILVISEKAEGEREGERELIQAPSPKAGRARARDPLFEALAIADGSDPAQLTPNHAKRIAIALAQIRKACPDLTVSEIQRRARIFPSAMPNGTKRTASGLAVNWAKCGGGLVGFAKAKSQLRPPPVDWRDRLEREYPGNVVNLENLSWASLDDEIRAKVFPESGHDVEIQPTPLQLTQ